MGSRIALGTVQFGLPYGLSDTDAPVKLDEVRAILDEARAAAIDTLDTAVAYGESERRLGIVGVEGQRIVSKLPPVPAGCVDVARWVREETLASLHRLQIGSLHGLLLHRSRDLREPHGRLLYHALRELQNDGLVRKIGVSIYDPAELTDLVPEFRFDLVQAPFNVLDRRIATSGWLARLLDAGTEVHARSVFLQGLLLLGSAQRPAFFARWQATVWDQWDRWLRENSLSPLRACLAFVLSHVHIDRIVVGVDNRKQLQEILTECTDSTAVSSPPLLSEDTELINPSRWILN
jgi:aryl-alcohol dehydrogenase-like predicted oxidoreductase